MDHAVLGGTVNRLGTGEKGGVGAQECWFPLFPIFYLSNRIFYFSNGLRVSNSRTQHKGSVDCEIEHILQQVSFTPGAYIS